MTSTANDASARAATVDAGSQRSYDNVGTVASAAEEPSSSVAEISRQVARSSEIASKAVGDAERPTPPSARSRQAPRRLARWSS